MKQHILSTAFLVSIMAVGAAAIPTAVQSQQSRPVANYTTSSIPLTADNTFEGIATVPAGRGVAMHRFDLRLPAGASLQSVPEEIGEPALLSEIMVQDKSGRVIGVVDSAWAQDASGNSLFTFFRIEGQTLVQTIDTSTADSKPVTAVLIYRGTAVEPSTPGLAKAYVGVPSNYVYNPSLGSRHDYCTSSPDEFPNPVGANADFRGPCARHDLCYGSSTSKFTCDNRLWTDMRSNCAHWYAWYNPARAACYRTADVYWAAVVVAT